MKKSIFVAVLFVAYAMSVSAQGTIRYGYPCYTFNQLHQPGAGMDISGNQIAYTKGGLSGGGYECLLPENEETIVYGIALTANRPKDNDDSAGYTVYMYIVDDSNRMVCVDSATKYSVATEYLYYGNFDTVYVESLMPCYEYYFSQPHVINGGAIYLGARWRYSFMQRYSIYFGIDRCFCHNVVYLDSDTLRYAGSPNFWWGGFFPITKPRCNGCAEVDSVSYTSIGNGAAVVQWDSSGGHQDWQICYGPQGFVPDSSTAITTTAPLDTLTGLSDTAHYDVYVRARCVCCPDDIYTSWVGPLELCLTPLGIDEVPAPEVMLSPNPTTGMLTVGCEAAIEVVELYDMQGRCALSRECSGTLAVLDLKSLPAGSYVLVAHTAKGHATRTVEKR